MNKQTFDFIEEPSRKVKISGDYAGVIAGAGPAGIAAALASARNGARTLLLESHGCLGGVWTAGLLSWIIDAGNKTGIMQEISQHLDQRGARRIKGRNFSYDIEEMKFLLEELVLTSGVHVRLHTSLVGCHKQTKDHLSAVFTESKSGREAWRARIFIDTTGDGDLGALAGCGFDLGHPETALTQPMSLIALVTGVRPNEIPSFIGGGDAVAKSNLLAEMQRANISPSYGAPTLFQIRDDLFALMSNHAYGFLPTSAQDITQATLEARSELHRQVHSLRALGAPWTDLRIVATAEQIGIREGRRLHGFYQVTSDDLANGTRHADAACHCTFGMDVHSTQAKTGTSYDKSFKIRTQPYDIPSRALIAKDVNGLLMAGRCISGDFIAHSSYRVTGNAVAMGESAGKMAAHCIAQNITPWELAQSPIHTTYATNPLHSVH